ncbi:integral membrane protein [Seiridium cupressi]
MGTASTSSGLLYMGSVPEGQIRHGMDDGPSRRWELIAMAVPTTFIAAATVGLRLFTRIAIVRERISIDDYMVVAALIFSIATVVLTIKQTDYGLSYHQWDILFTDFNICVCGITIRRTAFIPNLFASRDQSWTAVDDYLYSYAEINAGILCASVPALKPLFIHCLPARLRSRKGSGRSSYPRGTYSTNSVVEQNRRRRRMQSESIKLSSIDGSTKHGRNFSYDEDGIQLWHTSSKEEEGLEKTAVVASRPTMGTANSNSEEMRGDGFVYNVRAAAASPRPINERGITVTRETSIQYDNE